jgi:serine/threonine-protein kinase
MPLDPGQLIGDKYRVARLIAEGGMGAVYEGVHERIRKRVAIKVLLPSMASDAGVLRRFEREAQAAATIGSPHIVQVFDIGELASGEPFMVLEYLEGETLAERRHLEERLPPEELVPIAIQLLDGLAAAHAAGIVHRDLKPANVFLVDEADHRGRFVKILDFGISKFRRIQGEGEITTTRPGMVLGTPNYMAPEQAIGDAVDHRADLYSVGAIMFRCLTGRPPFAEAETYEQLVIHLALGQAPAIRDIVPGLDPDLAAIVDRALAREPRARHADAAALADALRQWLSARGIVPPPGPSRREGRPSSPSYDRALTEAPTRPGDPLEMSSLATPSPSARLLSARRARRRPGGWWLVALGGGLAVVVAIFAVRRGATPAEPAAASAGVRAAPPSIAGPPPALSTAATVSTDAVSTDAPRSSAPEHEPASAPGPASAGSAGAASAAPLHKAAARAPAKPSPTPSTARPPPPPGKVGRVLREELR